MAESHISFSRQLAASCLWDFGEDDLVKRALGMSADDLDAIQALASQFDRPDYPLPDPGQRISHGHVVAYAAVAHFEGTLRALARGRRRSQSAKPPELGG